MAKWHSNTPGPDQLKETEYRQVVDIGGAAVGGTSSWIDNGDVTMERMESGCLLYGGYFIGGDIVAILVISL